MMVNDAGVTSHFLMWGEGTLEEVLTYHTGTAQSGNFWRVETVSSFSGLSVLS